jgi:hypothetical protein
MSEELSFLPSIQPHFQTRPDTLCTVLSTLQTDDSTLQVKTDASLSSDKISLVFLSNGLETKVVEPIKVKVDGTNFGVVLNTR